MPFYKEATETPSSQVEPVGVTFGRKDFCLPIYFCYKILSKQKKFQGNKWLPFFSLLFKASRLSGAALTQFFLHQQSRN